MRVTSSLATFSPTRRAKTEAFFLTRSASRPCPQASWNSTPPPPLPITTGMVPVGAGRARSLVMARRAALRANSSTSTSSNSSKPIGCPTDSRPVCIPASAFATHETEKRLRT